MFDELLEAYPSHCEALRKIIDYGQRFMWHEMTLETLALVSGDNVKESLMKFHDQCLTHVREHLNQFQYACIVLWIARGIRIHTDLGTALLFLKDVVRHICEPEARMAVECEYGCLFLNSTPTPVNHTNAPQVDLDVANKILSDVATYLDQKQLDEVHPLLHMEYFRLRMQLAYYEQNYEAYYKNTFKYLAYCDRNTTLDVEDPTNLAYLLAIAALKSPSIYHFGELMDNRMVTSHLSGSDRAVLLEILRACNEGDMDTWEKEKDRLFRAVPSLSDAQDELRQKMQTMAMLHLMFYSDLSGRTQIPFSVIAKRCRMRDNEVEFMLLRALAHKLIQGEIDGVKEVVKVTSVIPRFLQNHELTKFSQQIGAWKKTVADVEGSMHRQVEQLTKMFVM